jgi:hypothetical protein
MNYEGRNTIARNIMFYYLLPSQASMYMLRQSKLYVERRVKKNRERSTDAKQDEWKPTKRDNVLCGLVLLAD